MWSPEAVGERPVHPQRLRVNPFLPLPLDAVQSQERRRVGDLAMTSQPSAVALVAPGRVRGLLTRFRQRCRKLSVTQTFTMLPSVKARGAAGGGSSQNASPRSRLAGVFIKHSRPPYLPVQRRLAFTMHHRRPFAGRRPNNGHRRNFRLSEAFFRRTCTPRYDPRFPPTTGMTSYVRLQRTASLQEANLWILRGEPWRFFCYAALPSVFQQTLRHFAYDVVAPA